MNELSDALQNCLQGIEDGQAMETVLARYPDLESKLRPLLELSVQARSLSEPAVPEDVKRRGRVRLLQQAAGMRESKRVPHTLRIPNFSRAIITIGLVGALVLTSTGFVSASSGALPGDQLYPVKRTWEGVRLFFVFNPQEHDLLESEFDQERLNEIDELIGKKLTASITFTGLVTRQADGQWLVSGIPVSVASSTSPSFSAISDGAPVTIVGNTRSDGVVEAQQIQLLQPGGPLPPFEPSENNEPISGGEQEDGNAATTPVPVITQAPPVVGSQNSTGQKSYQFSGVVQSMKGNVWVINGQSVYTDQAEITGVIKVGSVVKFDGNFDSGGRFVVTTVEDISGGNSSSHRNNSGGNSSGSSGSGSGDHEQPGGGEGGGSSGSGSGEDSGH